jgi:hypothetical protein
MGRAAAIALVSVSLISCTRSMDGSSVEAAYDIHTGKLTDLRVNAGRDGKPNIHSFMEGSSFVRIEIDADEDGKVDRWEYYGRDQKLAKVGLSRRNDGKPDTWMYEGGDGKVSKVEVSTRHDGHVNRTEYYANGVLSRAEQDTDGDGTIDRWETYAEGVLATVGFDTSHSGKPTTTIDYR